MSRYNPLARFQEAMIPGYLNMKVRYPVAQYYYPAKSPTAAKFSCC